MKVNKIQTYNSYNSYKLNSKNYSSGISKISDVNFQGTLYKNFTLNPIMYYADKLYERSIISTRQRFPAMMEGIKDKMKLVKIQTKDGKTLNCLESNLPDAKNQVIFLHGVSQNIYNKQILYKTLLDNKINVLSVEYRGYGKNQKSMDNVNTLSKDVEAGIDYLIKTKKINEKDISLVGHSVGAFLAIQAAEKHPKLKSICLVSPISDMKVFIDIELIKRPKAMPKILKKLLKNMKFLLEPVKKIFPVKQKIQSVKVPTIIIHSKYDKIVPLQEIQKLISYTPNLRKVEILSNGGHTMDEEKALNIASAINQHI